MKNNFKIIIFNLILFFLISNNLNAQEEFNFDITELEISNQGNNYKGLKRGTVKSESGLIIEANKFEYNKLNNILTGYGNVKITDLINDYIILSEDITYLKNEEKIFTNGNTSAVIYSKYFINSSNVTLLRNDKLLLSSEFSVIKDDKNTQYSLNEFRYYIKENLIKGKNIEVISDYTKNPNYRDLLIYEDGIFNLETKNYQASDTKLFLKKDTFDVLENDPRIYGVSSSKNNELTSVNKGIFTSCKLNDKCPPWSIKAERIDHDQYKKQLKYKNAFLNIYNIPVMYYPIFFHPDPSVKRQSGILKPQLNSSEILGSSFQLPYFQVISDNKDVTFTPTIFDSEIYMFQSEYREKKKFSSFIADFGHAWGYKSKHSTKKNSISHLIAKYDLNLNFEKYISSNLQINLEKVTNDTYLKLFETNLQIDSKIKPLNQDKINSNIKFFFNTENSNLETGISAYENLNGRSSDRYQYILPYYNYNKILADRDLGQLNFSSNGYNDYQNTNSIRTFQTNNINFLSRDLINLNGVKNNFGIYFKNLNSLGKNYSNYKNSPQSEISSIYNFETSYPLLKLNENNVNYFTPKVSFRFNPGSMKDYSDSKRLIVPNSIFEIDRLGIGGDSFEKGKSLTAGFEFIKEDINNINKYFSIELASVFRDKEERRIPISSSIGNKSSNIFGSANYSISKNTNIDYLFSLDNDFNKLEYNNIGINYKFKDLTTRLNFIEENGKIGQSNSIEYTAQMNFDEDKSFFFNTRRNRETSLTEYYNLIYEYKNDCLAANIKYKKTYYQDRDIIPEEQIFFTLTLFPLTIYEQQIIPREYKRRFDELKK